MSHPANTGTIVHALWHGQPQCGFTAALPRDWPPGHAWEGPNAVDIITCPICKRWAQEFSKSNERRP